MKKWFKRRILSFKYAFKGIFYVFRTQTNMRIHFLAMILAISLALLLKIKLYEWLFLFLAIIAVLTGEMINTAIEEIMDLLYPEFNKKVGIIKDIAAGIVLLFAMFALIVGIVIFVPKLLTILSI